MNRDEAKRIVQQGLPEFLAKITERRGEQYVCPLCGSGNGPNGTPAGSIYFKGDIPYYKCFSCDFHGDTFDLIAQVEGLEPADAFKRAYEEFNLTPDQSHSNPATKPSTGDLKGSFTEYYKKCAKTLVRIANAGDGDMVNFLKSRGISPLTAEFFFIGYDPNWISPTAKAKGKNVYPSQRLIIPLNARSYIARAIDPKNTAPKLKEGKGDLFNRQALDSEYPIFVVEGEFDALSLADIGVRGGKIKNGINADVIALCSTGNYKLLLEALSHKKPKSPLILSLDNDKAGQATTVKLAKGLEELNVSYSINNISGEYKDPNDALIADRKGFVATVKQTLHEVNAGNLTTISFLEALEGDLSVDDLIDDQEPDAIQIESVADGLQAFKDYIKASITAPTISTGFTQLDALLDEGLHSGLYVVGAISSLGKTSFVLQVADQIAQQGIPVIFFSLEMSQYELMAKTVSRLTYLYSANPQDAKTVRGVLNGKRYENYSTAEKDLLETAMTKYAEFAKNLYIVEGVGNIGAELIEASVETFIEHTGKKPVVIIDYLQILAPAEPRATDKQNTDNAVLRLKRLSRDQDIPVIAISSLNRENYTANISLRAFKESGAIEYSSDVLIGLQFDFGSEKPTDEDIHEMKRQDPRKIELKILKNRNGQTGDSIKYHYYPKFNYFKETGLNSSDKAKELAANNQFDVVALITNQLKV